MWRFLKQSVKGVMNLDFSSDIIYNNVWFYSSVLGAIFFAFASILNKIFMTHKNEVSKDIFLYLSILFFLQFFYLIPLTFLYYNSINFIKPIFLSIFSGILISINIVIFTFLIRESDASTATSISYIYPVFVLLEQWLLNQILLINISFNYSFHDIIGGFLLILSAVLITIDPSRKLIINYKVLLYIVLMWLSISINVILSSLIIKIYNLRLWELLILSSFGSTIPFIIYLIYKKKYNVVFNFMKNLDILFCFFIISALDLIGKSLRIVAITYIPEEPYLVSSIFSLQPLLILLILIILTKTKKFKYKELIKQLSDFYPSSIGIIFKILIGFLILAGIFLINLY